MTGNPLDKQASGYCTAHQKMLYNRKAAKRAIREMGGKALREYRCTEVAGLWHVGHLGPAVMTGRIDAKTFYELKRTRYERPAQPEPGSPPGAVRGGEPAPEGEG